MANPDADFDAGDIVWVDLGVPVGREQGGRRPAMVISSAKYNAISSVMIGLPITRTLRDWPFIVALPPDCGLAGYVLTDQIRVIDPKNRFVRKGGRATAALPMVRAQLAALLGIPVSN